MKRRGKREYPIKLIKFNDLDREIDWAGKPVLTLCIRRDYEFISQTGLIRDVLGRMAQGFPIDLKVCRVEKNPTSAQGKVRPPGQARLPPSEKGKEKGRLLGVVDEERVKGFLNTELGWST